MGESWIVSNLNAALSTWNDKLAEIWSLLTESPQTFKGGQVWGVMTGIHSALQAIGYGLLVLFFAVGVMKTCGSFVEVKKPEHALKLFIRFALAKGAVTYGLELMLAVFSIVQGIPDPVSDYERKQYPNLRDYINAEVIPEMQKKLRQGFGRAIRTEQDSCVVAILDERAGIGGKYHDAALAALPTCPTTEKIEDVQQFIREQKHPDYFL